MKNRLSSLLSRSGWVLPAVLLTVGGVLLFPYLRAGADIAVNSVPIIASSGASNVSTADLDSLEGNRILIPKIDLNTEFSDDLGELDRTVIRYKFTAEPGQGGNSVLTAHNLRKFGNPLFSMLFMVEKDNEIAVSYEGRKLVYQVESKEIVTPEEANAFANDSDEEVLTLITCYPPTIDAMRLIVVAKLKEQS